MFEDTTRQIQKSFLYDLASRIDGVHFLIDDNQRGITSRIIQLFIKHVFIKHALQGINFCAWDADDLEGLQVSMPDELIFEIKKRKLSVVELNNLYFLIAPVDSSDENRYSLRRFLAEDKEFGLRITYGCFVPKKKMQEQATLAIILKLLSSIYTLEKVINPSLIQFIEDTKQTHYKVLSVLLRQKIIAKGSIEEAVQKRLMDYEKKLSAQVLSRIRLLVQNPMSQSDYFIFYHYLEKLLANIWRDMQAFTLLPIAEFTDSATIMQNRLMSYRLLINKNIAELCTANESWQDKLLSLKEPYERVGQILADTNTQFDECDSVLRDIEIYEHKLAENSFFAKIGFGKPKYTSDEIITMKREIMSECFIEIVKLAKTYRKSMVYLEFESPDFVLNDNKFRHYAMYYAKQAIDKLPMILRLPENRYDFELVGLQNAIELTKHES